MSADAMVLFSNRSAAGHALAGKLKEYEIADGIVLAVPKGGVPLGAVVARELGLPLDVFLSRRLIHPLHKEHSLGTVSLWGSFVMPHEDVSQGYIARETERIQNCLRTLRMQLHADKEPANINNKTVIVVDDGIATGNTLASAVNILRKHSPAKIILAAPVASKAGCQKLAARADELVTLVIPEHFMGIEAFYEDFETVTDEQVAGYIAEFRGLNELAAV